MAGEAKPTPRVPKECFGCTHTYRMTHNQPDTLLLLRCVVVVILMSMKGTGEASKENTKYKLPYPVPPGMLQNGLHALLIPEMTWLYKL